MTDIRISWNRAVSTKENPLRPAFIKKSSDFASDFFFASLVDQIIFSLSESSDDGPSAKEFLFLSKRNPFDVVGHIDCQERVILVPFQMVPEAMVAADVKNIASACLIGRFQDFQLVRSAPVSAAKVVEDEEDGESITY